MADKFGLETRLPRNFQGSFNMPQICDMGQTALLPLRRRACWGFFSARKIRRLRPALNRRCWVPEASTLTTRPPKHLFCSSIHKTLAEVKLNGHLYLVVNVTFFHFYPTLFIGATSVQKLILHYVLLCIIIQHLTSTFLVSHTLSCCVATRPHWIHNDVF